MSGWLSSQKWIAHFYRESNNGFIPGMVFLTTITSLYRGWWNAGWERSIEWSVSILAGFVGLLSWLRARLKGSSETEWDYIGIYCALTLGLLSIIAFWPRYLLLVTPFFILFLVQFYLQGKIHRWLLNIFLLVLCGQLLMILLPSPTRSIESYRELSEKQLFQEVYMMTEPQSVKGLTRDELWRQMVLVHQKIGTYSISLATPKYFYWPWQGSVKVPVRYSYRTDIGTLRGTCEQTFVRRGGVWKVVWNWHCVLPSYDGISEIIKERRTATEGKVLDQNNRVLSEVSLRPFVYLVPGKITNQDKLIYDAAELLGIQRFTIDQKMHENSPADFYVPIGFARSCCWWWG
jgi:hypothetical protein